MAQTNEQIFKRIANGGSITGQEINLLRRRCNEAGRDLWNWELTEMFETYGVPVDPEAGARGLQYLRRYANQLGNRERDLVNRCTARNFRFIGFRNFALHNQRPEFFPVYTLTDGKDSFDYTPFLNGPEIQG
jgi:hypothetical protein